MTDTAPNPVLEIRGLNVYYGASHALQGVDLTLSSGVLSVVGRNGMGKTTLCKAIMGLLPIASGSIAIDGQPIPRNDPGAVARRGVGYVPQGRRLWQSLTVDEHLKMLEKPGGVWSRERVYDIFPRLAERTSHGGGHLSGGEQQMLAIARALLQNPRLLIMDEPTEGLAPIIVDQVADMLTTLVSQREMDILLIEQNIRVATAVSEQVAIMINGRINQLIDSARLAADQALQQNLLGVGRHDDGEDAAPEDIEPAETKRTAPDFIYTVNPENPRRWSADLTETVIRRQARPVTTTRPADLPASSALIRPNPLRGSGGIIIVAGTMDTKARELRYVRDILRKQGLNVRLADLSLRPTVSGADIPVHEFSTVNFDTDSTQGDRIEHMAEAFAAYVRGRSDIAGMIALGGSGGSSVTAPALQSLPVGIPKILVSTVASGDISGYVGGSDIAVMPAVADIQGLNRITGRVLANAANALAGMVLARAREEVQDYGREAAVFTMFGLTTPCVSALTEKLQDKMECLVFHATGAGGRAMESIIADGHIDSVYDITTTEIADHIVGGILSAGPTRLDVFSHVNMPYIGAAGALDMVNFGAPGTIPEKFKDRVFYNHNPNVTLMRTTAEEMAEIGNFIAGKLNKMLGPFCFFLPEGGLSGLDIKGGAFEDKEADEAFFAALESETDQNADRRIIRTEHHINDPEFATLVLNEAAKFVRKPQSEREVRHG